MPNLQSVRTESQLDQQQQQLERAMANGNAPSREEFDAKLAAAEARTETRFVLLDGKIDRVLDATSGLDAAIREVEKEIKQVRFDVKQDYKYTRWSIAGIILAAVAALWLTQGNLLSAFQAALAVKDVGTVQKAPQKQ